MALSEGEKRKAEMLANMLVAAACRFSGNAMGNPLKFDTEADAMKHLQSLASLQRGDMVEVRQMLGDEEHHYPGIFTGNIPDSGLLQIWAWEPEGGFHLDSVPPDCCMPLQPTGGPVSK